MDVRLAEELARRAAVSIDNARLYTEHRRIADALQAALAPRQLPEIPGLRLAARYRPVGELNEVGGDFYDVYLRPGGEWLAVIGDVTGHGAGAAATTALVRYTLRAAALRPGPTTMLLEELNRAMLAQDASLCTIALLSIPLTTSTTPELSVCLAGHPRPLLLGGGGEITEVGTPGTVLGYDERPDLTETRIALVPGDTLLLYTDGLTESARSRSSRGQLHEWLQARPAHSLDALLAYLEALAVNAADGRVRDDIALLALQTSGAHPLPDARLSFLAVAPRQRQQDAGAGIVCVDDGGSQRAAGGDSGPGAWRAGDRAALSHAVRRGLRNVAVRRGMAVGGDRHQLRAADRPGARPGAAHAVADAGAVRPARGSGRDRPRRHVPAGDPFGFPPARRRSGPRAGRRARRRRA